MAQKRYSRLWTFAIVGLPFLAGSLTSAIYLVASHGLVGIGKLDPTDLVVAILCCGLTGAFGGCWCGCLSAYALSWLAGSEARGWVVLAFVVLFSAHTSLDLLCEMPKVLVIPSVSANSIHPR